MKNKLEKSIKIVILLLGISILLTNCEKDDNFIDSPPTSVDNSLIFQKLLFKAKEEKEKFNIKASTVFQNARGIDASFEAEFGTPLFDKTINLNNADDKPILVIPLLDANNEISNLLIGYEKDNIEAFKIINKSISEGTSFNREAPIDCEESGLGNRSAGGLFKVANDIKDTNSSSITIAMKDFPVGCFEIILCGCPSGWGLAEISCGSSGSGGVTIDNSGSNSGSGTSGGNNNSNTGNTGSGTSSTGTGSGNTGSGNTSDTGGHHNGTGDGGNNGSSSSSNNNNDPCGENAFDEYDNIQIIGDCLNNSSINLNSLSSNNLSAISNYINTNGCSENTQDFATQAIIALINNEVQTFEKFIELKLREELLINPTLLLDIECEQIVKWQTLAQHIAPTSVQNKIDSLPSGTFNDFEIQSLNGANGLTVNMDYFAVNITTLPNNSSTGNSFTADEFLDYFRRNLTTFAVNAFPASSTFDPYCNIPSLCDQETALWSSNDPLGALIYIDIPGDDGVVVCTEFEHDYWYFQTMNAPAAGNHPVSGTRQFGYELNTDGSYNFFVRGVDRFDSFFIGSITTILTQHNAFQGADELWIAFQNNINAFVNNPLNGGESTIIPPVTNRVNWYIIKDILEGKKPISDLGCN